MDETELPMQNAEEPNEEAYQPELQNMSPPARPVEHSKPRRLYNSFESTQSTEISSSQNSSKAYKDGLSQPPAAFSHRQRLQWLQARRETGLWAQCDNCSQWRYLAHVLDRHELPRKWYCSLNPDKSYADCSVPESPLRIRDEEDLIHSEYSAGSVVWARLPGWPWWPAMVDDCPDTEQFYWIDGFSDIPTHYNVVFFDAFDVTRSWVAPKNMKPFGPNKKSLKHLLKDKRYSKRIQAAVTQANDAENLPLANRLAKFSFIARYPGAVNPPKKISKNDLKRYKAQLKRKYNVAFPEESGTDSEGEIDKSIRKEVQIARKNNVILVGTPKSAKRAKVSQKDKVETAAVSSTKEAVIEFSKISDNAIIEIEDDPKSPEPKTNEPSKEPDSDQVDGTAGQNLKEGDNNDNSEVFKQPISMVAQAGSTICSVPATAESSIDNDTSKTYAPESESETESNSYIKETIKDIRQRMVSPSSDDFDF